MNKEKIIMPELAEFRKNYKFFYKKKLYGLCAVYALLFFLTHQEFLKEVDEK